MLTWLLLRTPRRANRSESSGKLIMRSPDRASQARFAYTGRTMSHRSFAGESGGAPVVESAAKTSVLFFAINLLCCVPAIAPATVVAAGFDCSQILTPKESLASLPFLQPLYRSSEEIRSEGGPQMCTGTIIHAHWRYYHFSLLEAGFAPERLAEREARNQKLAALYPQGVESNLLDYFERWSYEGIYNYEMHQAYLKEVAKAAPLLAAHYQRTFKFSREKSQTLARLAINLLMDRAAGTFPKDSMTETARILDIARKVIGSPKNSGAGLDGLLEDDFPIALRIALLTQRPAQQIALLADRVKPLDGGDESPLFFALRNHGNVRFLLGRGAAVDYQNGFGKTPLFYAIGFNDHKLVGLLLDQGAYIEHRYSIDRKKPDSDCTYNIAHTARTPLMHAAQHADPAMLELLLKRGASLNNVDGVGHNATDYALQSKQEKNTAYLKSRGLASLQVEKALAQQKKVTACIEGAKKKNLKDKALRDFYSSCFGD